MLKYKNLCGVDPRGFQKCGGPDSRDTPPPPVGDAPDSQNRQFNPSRPKSGRNTYSQR